MKITNAYVDLNAKFIEKMISLTTTIFFYIYVFYNVLIGNINIGRFIMINIFFFLLLKIVMCFLKYIRFKFLLCEYTIYYYFKNSPEEITDMEIINIILNKCFLMMKLMKIKYKNLQLTLIEENLMMIFRTYKTNERKNIRKK